MSKGSNPRPVEVPRDQFRDNWDRIFAQKQPAEAAKPPGKTPDAK